jgi:spore coat polysaccharide biosynthesis protein SpsF
VTWYSKTVPTKLILGDVILLADWSVIIEARMNSSRLPGKVLYNFGQHKAIEIMIKRLELLFPRESIIIATTQNKSDDIFCDFLASNSVQFFRGSESDVMDRVMTAAKLKKRSHIVSLTGDCPLIDPIIIDRMIHEFNLYNVDYLANFIPQTFPDGMEVQLFTLESLGKVKKLRRSPEEQEHTGLVFRNHPELFSIRYLKAKEPEAYPGLGLTLDESLDGVLIGEILKYFSPRIDFSCAEILSFLQENSELILINKSVKRRGV